MSSLPACCSHVIASNIVGHLGSKSANSPKLDRMEETTETQEIYSLTAELAERTMFVPYPSIPLYRFSANLCFF